MGQPTIQPPATSPPLIELRDVSYEAGGHALLRHVSWDILSGEHWGILGRNGSGKTTLLQLATGALRPNAGGHVRWLGDARPDLRQLRKRIGWVTANLTNHVLPRETTLELVISGRHASWGLRPPIRTPATRDVTARARELLAQAGCDHLASRPFVRLSQGEQQLVLLARARMALPLILILDEPCGGLDPGARERFLGQLTTLVEGQDAPTLVMVTHQIEELIPAISQILVMVEGRIEQRGSKQKVLTCELLGRLYGEPPSRIDVASGRHWPRW